MSMQTPQRFVVIFRPKNELPEYIGPFVSKRLAEQFVDTLDPEAKTFIRPLLARQDVEH